MRVKILPILICAVSLISLQGCFSFHSTTVRDDNPPSQTTTVVPPGNNGATVTTTSP